MRYFRHFSKYKHQAISAFRFYWQAKTIYNIHSPLLYNLLPIVNKADSSDKIKLQAIRQLINKLKTNQTNIHHEDFGEGSRKLKNNNEKTVKKIYYSSSTKMSKGKKFYKICQFFKPKTILELGTNLGVGTSFLALGNPNAKVTSVEGDPTLSKKSESNIASLNIFNVTIINNKFDTYLNTLSDPKDYDLVFIDGNHNYISTMQYFHECYNESKKNQVIIVDDIYWSREMTKAWKGIQDKIKKGYCIDFFDFGVVINSQQIDHTIQLKYISKKWKPFSFGFWG